MSLSQLDLNLLLVLHTVLAERSIARAAGVLHVTPSAVSNSLARLRAALGDPLVTRKGRGVVPTPRAAELAPALARALGDLDQAIHQGPFEPVTCARTFTLAVADSGQLTWVPGIAGRMAAEMPRAHLRVVSIDSLVSLGDLASPEVDLHLGVRGRGPGLHVEPLFEEQLALVARGDHPALGARLSARELGGLRHVAVEMVPGKGLRDPVAAAYARAGMARDVALTVPTFTAAAAVASATDLVATLPASLLAVQRRPLGLRAVAGPVPAASVGMALCWHERTHADPASAWFRALVRRTVKPEGKATRAVGSR